MITKKYFDSSLTFQKDTCNGIGLVQLFVPPLLNELSSEPLYQKMQEEKSTLVCTKLWKCYFLVPLMLSFQ